MSRMIISQLCLSTSILIHDVDLSRSSRWWCASLALKGIFAFSGGVVVFWSSSSSTSIGVAIGPTTLASSASALSSPNSPTLSSSTSCPWFGSMVAVTVASWLNLSSASPSFPLPNRRRLLKHQILCR